jgi:hypothetical protein
VSTSVEGRLAPGQLPLDELSRVKSVKDVRSLRPCACCGGVGNADTMIDWDNGEWLHGRCFVARYGRADLCHLPKGKTDRLTLGDLGIQTMQYLLNHRSRNP